MPPRTLFYGGSFNPVHHAHLIVARAVAESAGYEQILLIPSAQPPHKPDRRGPNAVAPADHRLAMCRLAVAGSDLFAVSDVELARTGPSYTIDTARHLRRHGYDRIPWLIGGDTVPQLANWHEPEALLAEVAFVVVARPGWTLDWDALPIPYRALRGNVVAAPLVEISATDVRRRVAAGRSIDYLTPSAVAAYIRDHELYRT